jgi:hypothetical protein
VVEVIPPESREEGEEAVSLFSKTDACQLQKASSIEMMIGMIQHERSVAAQLFHKTGKQ